MCGWGLTEGGSCLLPGGVLAGFGLVDDCLVDDCLVAGGSVGGGHCALSAAGSCLAGGCHLVWEQSLKSEAADLVSPSHWPLLPHPWPGTSLSSFPSNCCPFAIALHDVGVIIRGWEGFCICTPPVFLSISHQKSANLTVFPLFTVD